MTASVFNVKRLYLNSKKHCVKLQFYMLYINFWSEHLSI